MLTVELGGEVELDGDDVVEVMLAELELIEAKVDVVTGLDVVVLKVDEAELRVPPADV